MRGAGCTLNDIADRDYDARVARTRLRPMPSGRITVAQAVAFLLAQLAVGAAVLFSLNRLSILLGLAVLGLIGTYPFMKRITYWPQLFLGLNFNWGALIGWTAVTGSLGWPAVLLYLGGVFWTSATTRSTRTRTRRTTSGSASNPRRWRSGSRTRPFLFAFYAGAALLWGSGRSCRRSRDRVLGGARRRRAPAGVAGGARRYRRPGRLPAQIPLEPRGRLAASGRHHRRAFCLILAMPGQPGCAGCGCDRLRPRGSTSVRVNNRAMMRPPRRV